MWGRLFKKSHEARYGKGMEEAMNETLYKEQKSQEQQLKLWKDRPRKAKEEIPDKVFQILQKQHGMAEDDTCAGSKRRSV